MQHNYYFRKGRIAFLTDIFTGGLSRQKANGRGILLTNWLKSSLSAEEYLRNLTIDEKIYNPFNLVLTETTTQLFPPLKSGIFDSIETTWGPKNTD